jgi:hypothetical protein
MVFISKISLRTFIAVLIQSVLVAFVQDTFRRCYDATIQPYYQTMDVNRETACARACLGNAQCAGFDICSTDPGSNAQAAIVICILGNLKFKDTASAHLTYDS